MNDRDGDDCKDRKSDNSSTDSYSEGIVKTSDATSTGREDSSEDENDDDSMNSWQSDSQVNDIDDMFVNAVRDWTRKIPIGLGLCPWAIQSERKRRLQYITCLEQTPEQVLKQILVEAQHLTGTATGSPTNADVYLSLRTTLLICPNVEIWKADFSAFDAFVKNCAKANETDENYTSVLQHVTLVAFHPHFLRWRGLPPGISVGSTVYAHKGASGIQKSQEQVPVTILETKCAAFGRRKIKVRFHDDGKERYIPTDWCTFPTEISVGPPLPDNAMHQAPYPTIHLIRNADLAQMSLRDASRVKRQNSQRMIRLGWEGMRRHAGLSKPQNTCPGTHVSPAS